MNESVPILAVPILNRGDLLLRLFKSIDYPVDKLLVIRNEESRDKEITAACEWVTNECPLVKSVSISSHVNAGVGGSWNEVPRLLSAPWYMIVGNDIQFTTGDMKKMADAAWEGHHEYSFFFGNHGHSLYVWTQRGIDIIGTYDENIFPCYTEDCEIMWRRHVLEEKYLDVAGVSAIHGEMVNGVRHGSSTIRSNPEFNRKNSVSHQRNMAYYFRKWGGITGQEKFTHPFNDPSWPVSMWKFDPKWREGQQW